MSSENKREGLASGLGFLLVSAGCAVGLGNVWRFPYIVGQYGGAIFVMIYIAMLIVFGLPMLVAEFSVGRAAGQTLSQAYRRLVPGSVLYRILGPIQVCGNWLLLMFYTTVAGWLLAYPFHVLTGKFAFVSETARAQAAAVLQGGADTAAMTLAQAQRIAGTPMPGDVFSRFISDPVDQIFWMTIVVLIAALVCAFGVQKGVERVTKWMMAALFLLLIVLAGYVLMLPGALEGVSFYLKPNLTAFREYPLTEIIFAAMGQSFFTLSIGIGSMAIFGSYTSRKQRLTGEAAKIIGIDTCVALLSGLIVIPACFAFNVMPGQGPGLIFMALPEVFAAMPFGGIVGGAFFILLALAALTTVITVYENIIATQMDGFGLRRRTAQAISAPLLWMLSIPCALGFSLLSGIQPLGEGSTILDFEDFCVSNVMLPLGSLMILIFCVSRRYWGWERFLDEANTGKGLGLPRWLRIHMTYIIPVMLLSVFVFFILDKFGLLK